MFALLVWIMCFTRALLVTVYLKYWEICLIIEKLTNSDLRGDKLWEAAELLVRRFGAFRPITSKKPDSTGSRTNYKSHDPSGGN